MNEIALAKPLDAPDTNFAVNLTQYLVVPAFALNGQGEVTIWNKACERLTGIAAKEVIGTTDHWRAFYDVPRPCLADLVVQGRTAEIGGPYEAHTEVLNRDIGVHVEEWFPMPRIGSKLYLAIDAGAMYDASGAIVAVVETLRDLTYHKRARMDLESVATTDTLTGISNRRGFDQRLVAEWARAQRLRRPLTLLLIEVDCFSEYQDAYGRAEGDECLRSVANALKNSVLRPSDTAARYGGHRFALVLPSTDVKAARTIFARILKNVASKAIPHSDSAIPMVSVSIGVATIVPDRDRSSLQLMEAADNALSAAKDAGGNRVGVWSQPPTGAGSWIRRLLHM